MPFFVPAVLIIIGFFIGLFVTDTNSISIKPAATTPIIASTTPPFPIVTLPSVILPRIDFGQKVVTTDKKSVAGSVVATTTSLKAATPSAPLAEQTSSQPATPTPAPLAPSGSALLDTTAATLRAALVNIICMAPASSTLHSISGSGVFVDSKGIILTNAHVAQYFLLADRDISCTIRSGSPATDHYKGALIYISPSWIHANPNTLSQATPIGTGEYDFALVAVTKSAIHSTNSGQTTALLPSSFPSITLAQLPPASGTPIVIASYGAQFLISEQIQSALFPTVVFGSVKDIFTFATNSIDVLSLGGSAAAQEGSSGGGIADSSGNLIGTITTSTVQGSTDTRNLSAITASYIRAEYARQTMSSIDALIAQSPDVSINDFDSHIPLLESLITAQLP